MACELCGLLPDDFHGIRDDAEGPMRRDEEVPTVASASYHAVPDAATAPCPSLIRDPDERVSIVTAWAEDRWSAALRFERSAACQGVGGFARRDIFAGDIILRIDRTLVVTQQTCCETLGELEAARVPEFSCFVLWLVHERLRGDMSAFHGFVRTLPSPDDMSSAIYMDDAALSALSVVTRDACARVRQRADACLEYIAAARPAFARSQLDARLFDRALLTWAASIVLSRAFCVSGRMVLLPLIDLVNSSRDCSTCELQFDARGEPVLRATSDVACGVEVMISYGSEKCDAELLASYGYSHKCEPG